MRDNSILLNEMDKKKKKEKNYSPHESIIVRTAVTKHFFWPNFCTIGGSDNDDDIIVVVVEAVVVAAKCDDQNVSLMCTKQGLCDHVVNVCPLAVVAVLGPNFINSFL